jgi:glutathione transport system ATP-binding protein
VGLILSRYKWTCDRHDTEFIARFIDEDARGPGLNSAETAASARILDVQQLTVHFTTSERKVEAVRNLCLHVDRGETLAIVGESGSGKSVSALAIMRLVEHGGGRIIGGQMQFHRRDGRVLDLAQATQSAMRELRGADLAMIFQEPMTSLNPVFSVGEQIAESIRLHQGKDGAEARAESLRMLELVRIPESRRVLGRFPHQLSGGMRQRVMIAMALSCRPSLLIADEPTTALDVTIQAQILQLIRELQREMNMGVIFITHDMGVVAEIADRVLVMYAGERVEEGSSDQIFAEPRHPYTRSLLSAVPRLGAMRGTDAPARFPLLAPNDAPPAESEINTSSSSARRAPDEVSIDNPTGTGCINALWKNEQFPQGLKPAPIPALDGAKAAPLQRNIYATSSGPGPLLAVRNLTTRFDVRTGIFGRVTSRVHAVEQVSFDLYAGETLALVGESGCGKSTTGRSLLRLVDIAGGKIEFDGRDITQLSGKRLQVLRRNIQVVFQDPYASLDPRLTVGYTIMEPLLVHRVATRDEAERRVAWLLERVGLLPEHAQRYPHEFSGGQRQRIAIARALALNPKIVIADESVSALDVSIRAQIINLLLDLQRDLGISFLFISHDMAVVERVSHRVAVMYLGQIVEIGPRRAIFEDPRHAYTRALLSAVPIADPARRHLPRSLLADEMPSPIRAVGDEPEVQPLKQVSPGHFVATHRISGMY